MWQSVVRKHRKMPDVLKSRQESPGAVAEAIIKLASYTGEGKITTEEYLVVALEALRGGAFSFDLDATQPHLYPEVTFGVLLGMLMVVEHFDLELATAEDAGMLVQSIQDMQQCTAKSAKVQAMLDAAMGQPASDVRH